MSHNLGCSNIVNLTLNTVRISTLKQRRNFGIDTTSRLERWNNVGISTLKQRPTFNVEANVRITIDYFHEIH